ncbi:MAG TPA: hypothetical protein HPP94_02675 [Desulfuromonadales bacterium]|nr:hypothetical protein [Desulfuromonadales bacterium]
MAEHDIIQNMIFQLGQSQNGRRSPELDIHYADLDERSSADLAHFIRTLAAGISFIGADAVNGIDGGSLDGDWSAFFPDDTALEMALKNDSGDTRPHLALLLAFLELYKIPQEVINRISGRHLDFYYQKVLQLVRKAPLPDKAHLLLELKKNAAPLAIGAEWLFSAGKDAAGSELIYIPTRTTVISGAAIDSLRSLFIDTSGHGRVLQATVANSADGRGGDFSNNTTDWHGFGHSGLQAAETGFALAAPVLRMQAGTRTVSVTLTLAHFDQTTVTPQALSEAFAAFITAEQGWLGPFPLSAQLSSGNGRTTGITLSFTIPATEKAIINFNPKLHGSAGQSTAAPLLRLLLKENCSSIGYNELKRLTLLKTALSVAVSHITALTLENDTGALDPQKPFLPFGSQPTCGSRVTIGCDEAFSKKLSELQLAITWKDAPASLSDHYTNYSDPAVTSADFTAAVSFHDGGSWGYSQPGLRLFESGNSSTERIFTFRPGSSSVSSATKQRGRINEQHRPVTLTLEHDFLHTLYRKQHVANLMTYSRDGGTLTLLNEPYTPAIRSISLSYRAATASVTIAGERGGYDDFNNSELEFFHISYFGLMREHGYQRRRFPFLRDPGVHLLPTYDHQGELLIGFINLQGGNSVSVLFQVAEGSADPELPPPQISWSVLCDNYWKQLQSSELLSDTTNRLLTSGIISFAIPAEATTAATILPGGRIWLKGGVTTGVQGVSRLIMVAANAIEVEFCSNGTESGHLQSPLPQGSISRMKTGAVEIKNITQPFASFGGRPTESTEQFSTRVSERLRHKNRCISASDYERVVLEAFPQIHTVKCIPHATPDCWLKPGNVLLVVVPDLRNRNAVNLLEPKVDADTLSRIVAHVRKRAGMQIAVQAKNPRYQKIQLDFKVRFREGYEPNFYRRELEAALIRFLSPWAFHADREIAFGGKIYKSVLLDVVEELEYIDFVTDFRMYSFSSAVSNDIDIATAEPATPDTILVSAASHIIQDVYLS